MTDWSILIYFRLISVLHTAHLVCFSVTYIASCVWSYHPSLNDLWWVNSDLWLYSFSITILFVHLEKMIRSPLSEWFLTEWFMVNSDLLLFFNFYVAYSPSCVCAAWNHYTTSPVRMIYDWLVNSDWWLFESLSYIYYLSAGDSWYSRKLRILLHQIRFSSRNSQSWILCGFSGNP